ncbi:MFS transporter [Providencia stuartii]|uniref:MFS transporter n=1 Tax=Providencia stuartii TaxID=588 RepID=UPI0023E1A2C2|nr:MFS transporter [Providencia stuartii]ELR5143786.1 MFS transporter [Providencia stuartii]WER24088.1 MFS transporter [Providencia stuartii]WER28208.1 MFS transporter [Providencia stuartii]WER32299.1 MFS transporter [Providencia stuartii]
MSTSAPNSPIPLLRISISMFFSYMTIGLPLTVIPLFVHQELGFNDVWVGVVVGVQFLATVLTRGYAGRLADQKGAKRTTLQGMSACGISGVFCLLAILLPVSSIYQLLLLIIGRLVLGLGESQLLTGNLTWGMRLAGAENAGKVMSWNGMAIYGSLAVGAPLGLIIYQQYGFMAVGGIVMLLPCISWLINGSVRSVTPLQGNLLPFWSVIRKIWKMGMILALKGIGFAAIGTFISLYFVSEQWGNAGLAMSAFGCAFVLVRVFWGGLPDRVNGYRIALISLLIEFIGLITLWLAPVYGIALFGAALTGAGCSLIYPAVGTEVVKAVAPQMRGTALGGYSAFQDIAYGVTGPLAGMVVATLGYRGIYLIAAMGVLIALMMTLSALRHIHRIRE